MFPGQPCKNKPVLSSITVLLIVTSIFLFPVMVASFVMTISIYLLLVVLFSCGGQCRAGGGWVLCCGFRKENFYKQNYILHIADCITYSICVPLFSKV